MIRDGELQFCSDAQALLKASIQSSEYMVFVAQELDLYVGINGSGRFQDFAMEPSLVISSAFIHSGFH